ncbi:hypothetical protein LXL04_023024 [Taraxacum kok-saghyz]
MELDFFSRQIPFPIPIHFPSATFCEPNSPLRPVWLAGKRWNWKENDSNSYPNHLQHHESSIDVFERVNGVEVFLDLVVVCSKSSWCGHEEISKLFDKMSELKLAYVQLQEAHIPYDPDKIKAADELVFSNLDGLCKVRRSFKEKQFQKSNSLSACLTVLRIETKVRASQLEITTPSSSFSAGNHNSEITHLKSQLRVRVRASHSLDNRVRASQLENASSVYNTKPWVQTQNPRVQIQTHQSVGSTHKTKKPSSEPKKPNPPRNRTHWLHSSIPASSVLASSVRCFASSVAEFRTIEHALQAGLFNISLSSARALLLPIAINSTGYT